MIRRIIVTLFYIMPLWFLAQDASALWSGHFSYLKITKVVEGGGTKIYAASENAIFSYDIQTREIDEITTVNGLSGDAISTIYYSDDYATLLVGYENGLMEVVLENDNEVLSVVDILDKTSIPPNEKRINHFNADGNLVYISTDFGISVYDMERLEFGDTYLIGNSGSQIKVNQTTIFEGFIYAACGNNQGIRKGSVLEPNLIDYRNWETPINGNYLGIEALGNTLYATSSDRRIYEIDNDIRTERFTFNSIPLELSSSENTLSVTTVAITYLYDESFNLIGQIDKSTEFDTEYNSAITVSDYVYIGTEDFGVLKTPLLNPSSFEEIHPEGPLLNTPFSVRAQSNNVWVTFGEYTIFLNPYPL